MTALEAISWIVGIVLVFTLVYKSVVVVREKQNYVIEHFGKFHTLLRPGIHFIIPFVQRPKSYSERYFTTNPRGQIVLVEHKKLKAISTQNEVLDFPKTHVISRDNASCLLDAVLSWRIHNSQTVVYTTQNLPLMLSKLLQAQLRNVAGTLDIDQLIEESSSLNVLTGLMDAETSRWGVRVEFVKIQKIEAPDLAQDLAKKKDADLKNKEVIIQAKQKKQTEIIESEGMRDSIMKRAEGEAQEMIARSRGAAQSIINRAQAEARSIREMGRALSAASGENPAQYFLAIKYLEALRRVMSTPGVDLTLLPAEQSGTQPIAELPISNRAPLLMLSSLMSGKGK